MHTEPDTKTPKNQQVEKLGNGVRRMTKPTDARKPKNLNPTNHYASNTARQASDKA